jgi:hypothetical protein
VNAAELYEIVKDVPREAWPDLKYQPAQSCPVDEWRQLGTNWRQDVDVAEAAFVGAMVAWLFKNKKRWPIPAAQFPVVEICGRWSVDKDPKPYPTLIAALAAACKEARP